MVLQNENPELSNEDKQFGGYNRWNNSVVDEAKVEPFDRYYTATKKKTRKNTIMQS